MVQEQLAPSNWVVWGILLAPQRLPPKMALMRTRVRRFDAAQRALGKEAGLRLELEPWDLCGRKRTRRGLKWAREITKFAPKTNDDVDAASIAK